MTTLYQTMNIKIADATDAELVEWRKEIDDELRAPSLRTLAWTNRRKRLEDRLEQVHREIVHRASTAMPFIIDGSGQRWDQLPLL